MKHPTAGLLTVLSVNAALLHPANAEDRDLAAAERATIAALRTLSPSLDLRGSRALHTHGQKVDGEDKGMILSSIRFRSKN
jgi:hypothetical protein